MLPVILLLGAAVGVTVLGKTKMTEKKTPTKFNRLDPVFIDTEIKYGVDWKLLKAISLGESDLGENPRVKGHQVSYDGLSWGIMQFTLSTARQFDSAASVDKLNDENYSIDLAGRFFKYLKGRFTGATQERDIVMSYNHGEGNQKKFLIAEKNKTLKESDYRAGRDYYNKYLKNLDRVNKGE